MPTSIIASDLQVQGDKLYVGTPTVAVEGKLFLADPANVGYLRLLSNDAELKIGAENDDYYFIATSNGFRVKEPTNPNIGTLANVTLTGDRTWNLPDASGTLALASQLTGGTVTSVGLSLPSMFSVSGSPVTTSGTLTATLVNQGANTFFGNNTGSGTAPTFNSMAALTSNNDTNVTLSLGGTPATALMKAVSLTLGWTGTLAVSRGGTGAGTLTGVVVGNGTSAMTGVAGTANQLLRRNAANTAYEFFTPTYLTAVPTLQQVTTAGNNTTNNITQTTNTTTGLNGTNAFWSAPPVTSAGQIGAITVNDRVKIIKHPAIFNSVFSATTGAVVFKHAVSANTVVRIIIKGTTPSNTAINPTTIEIQGNIDGTGAWQSISSRSCIVVGANNFADLVRIGTDGSGNVAFVLGDTSTIWPASKFWIDEIMVGNTGVISGTEAFWETGWSVALETSLAAYTLVTPTLNKVAFTSNIPAQVNITGSNGIATSGTYPNITISPTYGTSANTIAQGNDSRFHDAVTLGTANGLSLNTQQLSLGLASTSTTGALSSTDWNTFNNKAPSSYVNSLTLNTNTTLNINTLFPDNGTSVATVFFDATTTGNYTITLPTYLNFTNKRITIKRVDTNLSSTVTIDANGSETIDGQLTYSLTPLGVSPAISVVTLQGGPGGNVFIVSN